MDSGLQCLALVAQLQQLAVDPAQLKHKFGLHNEACSIDHILGAAKCIGFKAKSVYCGERDLNARALPAIAQAKDGSGNQKAVEAQIRKNFLARLQAYQAKGLDGIGPYERDSEERMSNQEILLSVDANKILANAAINR